ncbi:hypothetical protein SUGI_0466820 [Cryptomeria japonica]|nr:hypothetical protein SUGI_0466820 [Cryptomeria japonica]
MITFRHFNSIMEAIVLYLKYTTARARHNAQASSHLMMATSGGNENSTEQIALSLLGKACMRMDLITIHDIMMAVQYDDDSVGELSFRGWTINMQNILNARKHGDLAFQDKDFGMAILWYNRVTLERGKSVNVYPDIEVIALSPNDLMTMNQFVCQVCNKRFQCDQNM